jgi:hypothetical protein
MLRFVELGALKAMTYPFSGRSAMAKVFISYRNDDDPSAALLLADRIDQRFGSGSAFLDSRSIQLGVDFRTELWGRLAKCRAMVIVVGAGWLRQDAGGDRRIDRADDFVRLEIEFALRIGIPVIPVLVGGAVKPTSANLPESLIGLAHRQYLTLRQRSADQDMGRLLDELHGVINGAGVGPATGRPPREPARGGIIFNGRVEVAGDVVNGPKYVTQHD